MPEFEMRAYISGTRDGADWPKPGERVTLPADEGSALVAAGLAVEAAVPAPVETATVKTSPKARSPK